METYKLTDQEKKIMYWLSWDLSEQQIADKLFISVHTVKTHKKNIRRKTGAFSDKGIVRMYVLAYPKQFALALMLAFVQLFASVDVDTDMQRTITQRISRAAKRARVRVRNKDFSLV